MATWSLGWKLPAVALAAALLGASQARAACSLGKLAELPVTMSGLRPIVHAGIEGRDVLFIADSGAFFSLISPASAAELKLPLRSAPPNFQLSGVGGLAFPSLTTVKTFRLAGSDINDIDFLVAGGDTGADSVGLLGQNVLAMADLEFDLEHGAIRLMEPHGCDRAELAYWAGDKPFSMVDTSWGSSMGKFIYFTVSVNGSRMRALLDSGASLSGMSLMAARRAGLRPEGPGVVSGGFGVGIGRKMVRSWIAPVKSVKIGDEEIQNAHIRIEDFDLGEADMLLGADFLLSHRVYVSNRQHRLFFTYDGGPIFNLEAARAQAAPVTPGAAPVVAIPLPKGAAPDAPSDAEGYARRAAVHTTARDYAGAAADYDKALELAPDRADLLRRRALVRAELGKPFLAMNDLDAALKLQPHDVDAHLMRATLRMRGHDRDGAKADLDAAAQDAAKQSDARLQLGNDYARIDEFGAAIDQYDLWIASHADDGRMGSARTDLCWAKAFANRDLDHALGDCNAGVRAAPTLGAPRAGRGMVELRRGDWVRAAADFDAALKVDPKVGWWLYGRGLAELKSGREAEGRADLAAAAAVAPKLAERAGKLGLPAPPG